MNFEQYLFETLSPEVFGPKHLVGSLFVMLLIALILILTLIIVKNKNHSRVLKFTALFILTLELTKYLYTIITIGSLPLHYIPMQLCSFSLYLMPLTAFSKGKVAEFFRPTTFAIGLMAGLTVLFYPATVLGVDDNWFPLSDNVIQIISFLFHGTMVFFAFYLVLSKTYVPKFKDYPRAYATLLVFAMMAVLTNAFFSTDMMVLNTANGSPFQFVLLEYGRLSYMLVMLFLAMVILILPFAPSAIRSIRFTGQTKKSQVTSKN
jgi:uncharacterized membrane protein YwaF